MTILSPDRDTAVQSPLNANGPSEQDLEAEPFKVVPSIAVSPGRRKQQIVTAIR
jgi:hypothetical protein